MTQQSTLEVAGDVTADVVRLVSAELALARRELRADLAAMRGPALACGAGVALTMTGADLLLEVLAVRRPRRAARLGLAMVAGGLALAVLGWRVVPKRVLADTRARLTADMRLAEEAFR